MEDISNIVTININNQDDEIYEIGLDKKVSLQNL